MKVLSEVTGSVWKVEVAVGQQVAEGDTLIIVESMKMEIPVESDRAGKVVQFLVEVGDDVTEGQPLMELQ